MILPAEIIRKIEAAWRKATLESPRWPVAASAGVPATKWRSESKPAVQPSWSPKRVGSQTGAGRD